MTNTEKERRRLLAQLASAQSALKVIHTWASYQNGRFLDPKDVAALCLKGLGKGGA